MTDELNHIGVVRRSGRYPWGSGNNAYQNNTDFLAYTDQLKSEGLTETQVASGLGITTTQLRARRSIVKAAQKEANISEAFRLKEKGMSTTAIGERMQLPESSVRALLAPSAKARNDILTTTSDMLRDQVDSKGVIDIGAGVENHLGISGTKLSTAVAVLREQGYETHNVQIDQVFGGGQKTRIKVLAAPGTTYKDIVTDPSVIKSVANISEDGGRSFRKIQAPTSVSSKRVAVRYKDEGGAAMDGVIQLRRGVNDLDLGGDLYAQVRIAVDDTHYMKGMAFYADDLPPGVDMMYNSNKKSTGNKLDAMKPMKVDPLDPTNIDTDLPFGSYIKDQKGALNIVNEQGAWNKWSKSLSTQVLSKQSPKLAKEQLDRKFDMVKSEFDEINALTNPVVKRKLMETFADNADASAVHLKAAALPRQSTKVILPVNTLGDNEIYAPTYRDGENVVLIRYPHGGKFEIPELRVNNRNSEARGVMRNSEDAVGINSKVASRLSGADFDGDSVLVIPNNQGKVSTSAPLAGLKDFDPQTAYPSYEGMKPMSESLKQTEMGKVSNLITDMTIRGASGSEIARAVRHSMVVIDAEKHKLNYKQSYKDNGIKDLKEKYQAKDDGKVGASTLISRATSRKDVAERTLRPSREGGSVDPVTGQRVYKDTGRTYVDNRTGRTVTRTTRTTQLADTNDASSLSSGTVMESVYANHSNRLKSLANRARKTALETKPAPYSKSARETYASEVSKLRADLNVALKNAPLERQAQVIANAQVKMKTQANPNMESDTLKKIKRQALEDARARTGASKSQIRPTPSQWEAIQAGAVSSNLLRQLLDNGDTDYIKGLATPKTTLQVEGAKLARAKTMLAAGYTQAEIADALGVPASTLNDSLHR